MASTSFDVNDPFTRLQIAATSSFFGEPAYYVEGEGKPVVKSVSRDSLSLAQRASLRATLNAIDPQEWRGLNTREMMERAIDAALAVDIERTLMFAVELRNVWNMRATPQAIMVRAAMHPKCANTGLIAKYAPHIMTRLDEVMNQMAYFESVHGSLKRIPSRLKRAWASRLSQAKEYELAKYKMGGRQVNVYDAVNLTHANSEAIDKLKADKLSLGGEGLETWESIRSSGGSWKDAAAVMGHMALLRNLRNLNSDKELTPELLKKLVSGVEGGKQLPFRYYAAYKAIGDTGNARIKDSLEECMQVALGHCPRFAGRTMSLVDNSGSARSSTTSSMGTMRVSSIGNLMGVITARLSDEGYVGVFGDNLLTFEAQKKTGIFDELAKAETLVERVGGGTENGIWMFFKQAIAKKEHWDNIFVYSDMQAGHGGLYGIDPSDYREFVWTNSRHIDVAKLIARYRKEVNPNVNVFMVQVAGYQDSLVPEFYDRTYILGGWSDRLLSFADKMISMTNQVPVKV
jgi:hypothetical protein